MSKNEWFAEWFDSPYYHTLYQKHDDKDAQHALDNLLSAMHLSREARVLDLACGKGRHARYLADKGFDVTGLDISEKSIAFASQFAHDRLNFYQHDMRLPFRINYYDAVVNFFTSFGYFDNDADHLRSIHNISKGLKPKGLLLLDYFNSDWIRQHLVPSEHKVLDGITFHLTKWLEGGHVFKRVEFTADGHDFQFQERVRLFDLPDFKMLTSQSGLQLKAVYGGYDLSAFDPATSTRLIILAEKR
jgi:SAM-dependent methyltransferase